MTCSVSNFGVMKARYDPADQLKWLEAELTQIEKIGWQAIIIGHMPPFMNCAQSWAIRYRALIERFQHVVRTSLFGYSHKPEISIVQALYSEDTELVNLVLNAGSISPFGGRNPMFSVIEFDAEYMFPTNLRIYWMNLTKANQENYPGWELLSNFTKDYNLQDMSPESIMNFSKAIKNNETMARNYLWNQDSRFMRAP
jgi:Acid sphingomyelin phosphodiesterase C-terminal region